MGLRNAFLAMLAQSAAPSYTAVATHYAVNGYIVTAGDFAGNANGKQGILSFWVKRSNNIAFILCQDSGFNFFVGANSNMIQIFGTADPSGTSLDLRSTTAVPNATWTHILASWDVSTGVGQLFFNGVDDTDLHAANDVNMKYTTGANWEVAGRGSPTTNACIAELYFAPNQFLDFTVSSNVEKFIVGGKPVSLGATGSLPTGTPPILYMRQNGANILVNSGTGGNFDSIVNTVDDCASSPSD